MESITGTVLALSGASGYDKNGKDFDILRDLLITTDSIAAEPYAGLGLVGALDTVPDLTVFAPEDNAFKGLAGTIALVTGNTAPMGEAATVGFLADALTLLGKGDPSGLLTDILTYHVTPGVFELADVVALGDGAAVPTLQGGTLKTEFDTNPPSLIDADKGVGNPGIIATDVAASNGVIHVLDGVLLPLSVSAILTQKNTDFEIGSDARDHFATGRGMDFIDGNGGNDIILAGSGNDVAIGGTGNDWIAGGWGKDTLIGEAGRDTLFGGKGNDTITGGKGNDWMAGGRGDDTFVFEKGDGDDTIVNFRAGHDKIDLTGYEGITRFKDIKDDIDRGFFKTEIDLDGGDSISLVGLGSHKIGADDFLFA